MANSEHLGLYLPLYVIRYCNKWWHSGLTGCIEWKY